MLPSSLRKAVLVHRLYRCQRPGIHRKDLEVCRGEQLRDAERERQAERVCFVRSRAPSLTLLWAKLTHCSQSVAVKKRLLSRGGSKTLYPAGPFASSSDSADEKPLTLPAECQKVHWLQDGRTQQRKYTEMHFRQHEGKRERERE